MSDTRNIAALIEELSRISDLKFVGGTSLFMQNKVKEIKDIDVLVQSPDQISRSFELTFIDCPVYKQENRIRAYFIHNNILVDVFIQRNNEETIDVNGTKCTTIESEINFLERTLVLNISNENRQSTIAKINYLKALK